MSTKFNLKTIFNQGSRSRYSFLILVLLFALAGFYPVKALGLIYYVDNTNPLCSDAGTGLTPALPFCTIGHGASVATFGDEVRVVRNYAPTATYVETVTVPNSGTAVNPIIFSAVSGVTVTGNGTATGSAFRLSSRSYIVVDGFTITGTTDYGIYVFGSNNITISNNHVSYSGSPVSGSTRAGIYINSTTNSAISGNTTDHNSSHGILLTNGANNNLISNNITFGNAEQWQRNASGIRLDASTNNTLLHNIAYGNEDSGVINSTGSSGNFVIGNLLYGNGDHGIEFLNSPNNTVIGNTVQGNVTTGINFEGTAAPGSGGATVINNIMVDNGLLQQVGGGTASGQSGNLRFDANSLTGNTLDYNLFYLNSGTVQIGWGGTTYATLAAFHAAQPTQETHGLQADPLFVAPAPVAQRPAGAPYNVAVNVGNYHLTAGSTAIDSANSNASNEPTLDLDGNARVDDPFTIDSGAGTRTYDDRGAYEFQPTAGAALPSVTTQAVTNITQTSATGNGDITDLGISNPTQHGVVWSTSINPTIINNKTTDGPVNTTGAFTSNITGLTPATVYHVRAYAWNSAGISYGNDISFTSASNIYYVDKTNGSCSDVLAGAGLTPAFPFCTIGKGASIAVAGNTVRVLAGTYAETVNGSNSGSAGLPITYSAASGVTVTGNGTATGSAFRMSGKSYIVVDGFTITGTTDYGIYMFGSNNITISNNHVSYSGSPVSGSTRTGIYINSTTNSTISGNTTDHNSNHGILLTNGSSNNLVSNNISFGNAQGWQRDASGIRLDGNGTTNNTILHNISYGNEDSGITNYTGSSGNFVIGNLLYGNGDHGVDNLDSPNNTVIGNTVHGNVTAGINFEGNTTGSGGATVMNNIMVDNGLLQRVGGGTSAGQPSNLRFDATSLVGNTLDYNIFYLNSGTALIQWNGTNYTTLVAFQGAVAGAETHGLQANPLFSAPAPVAQRPAAAPYNVAVNVGNYHLTAGSPAIDSANSNASNEPTLDLEGNARVDDPSTTNSGAGTRTYDDRGVYEFQPTTGVALPSVTTQAVTAIGETSATGNGTLTDLGVPNPTAYGVVWSTTSNPTTADNVSDLGAAGATGAFTAPITGLTPGMLYHVRAFATNTVGTSYGADVSFTALSIPTVTTQAVTLIGGTSATGNGTITDLGVPNPTAYGVVWSTILNPTIADNVSDLGAAGATGAFTAPITGLTPGMLYHVRAFATNTVGTSYGADFTFTTLLTPTVTTQAVSAITTTTATGNGTLTDLGVPNPTAYGVVWNTATGPTTANFVNDLGAASATGAFTAPITGLSPNTLYYVRAFATNTAGTSYGNEVTFTTTGTAPTVTTQAVTAIGTTTATGNGNLTALGAPNPTAYGVVWNTATGPTTANFVSDLGAASATGAFTAPMTGLSPNTLYYVRAFATNTAGTSYGNEVTFTTTGTAPTVTTQAVTAIGTTTATGNGNVTALGAPNPTAYGVVWNTATGPTTANFVSDLGAASATGAFTAPMTGLSPNTLYYVRAFATNTAGTSYGNEVTFTTTGTAPTVTTQAVTAIGTTIATGNGNVTALGAPNPTAYGVVWNTATGPTTANFVSDLGAASATGAFTAQMTGLSPNTLYYVRAFATNTAGTSYGNEVTFTTTGTAPTVTTQAVTAIGTTTATGNGNLTALGAPNPTAYGVVWNTATGPTTANFVSDLGAASATGAFTAPMTGLSPNTLYYVRAFATNTAGTSYGNEVTFTTTGTAPTVTTQAVTAIGTTTATGNGNLTALGAANPTAYGVVWNTATGPTTANFVSDLGAASATGAFTAPMTGLSPNTLYYVRAFATNTAGTSYGNEVTFTTTGTAPTVTTQAVTAIGTTTATGNGNLTALGAPNPTAYGVVWNTATGPTTANFVSDLGAASATGAFTAPMTGLSPNTLYYVRAFATNTAGTSYGNEVTFTTTGTAPTVTTQAVTAIGTTTATGNGNVTALGAPNPTAYGVVWNTATGPTTANFVSDLGAASATGAFTAQMTGLSPNTLYYVRAFATNTAGTSYGNEVTFTTTGTAPTVTTQAVTAIGTTIATGNGNVTALGVPNPTAYGVVWNTATGPTTANFVSDLGAASATGAFTAPMTGLSPNTLYYVRAFATNTAGTSYGNEVTFTTSLSAPTATTNAATAITATSATLNGTVNANNNSTTVTFEYGLTNTYGSTIPATPNTVTGTSDTAVSAMLTGLTTNTTYHFRAVAVNGIGTTNGLDQTFTTLGTTVTTTIHNNATDATITDGTIGMVVHDSATVVGTGGVPPTGTVTFTYYDNPSCSGTGTGAGIINLNGAGVAHPSNAVTVASNGLSFKATYNGDTNYVSGTSACETLNTPPVVITNGVEYNAVGNPLSEFQVVAVGVNKLLVTFNKNVQNLPATDPNYSSSVINPANYMLVNDNGNGFDDSPIVTSCNTNINPNGGNDLKISVDTVTFSDGGGSGPFTATLNVNNGQPLADGIYRLYVCGTTSITDLNGQKLAGNGSTAGADFLRNFIVNLASGAGDPGSGGGGKSKAKTLLPATGFAPDVVTILPTQPAEKVYTAYGDLTLEIPALKVKTSIVGVPEAQEGWDVTWLGNSAGWLNGTAFPTWNGNSVITGHVWDANNNPGIFVDLKKLKYGDQAKIHAWGQIYTYEVRETLLVSPYNINTVLKHEDKAWVTLVTCEDFNVLFTKYSYRRVVRAILLSVTAEK